MSRRRLNLVAFGVWRGYMLRINECYPARIDYLRVIVRGKMQAKPALVKSKKPRRRGRGFVISCLGERRSPI